MEQAALTSVCKSAGGRLPLMFMPDSGWRGVVRRLSVIKRLMIILHAAKFSVFENSWNFSVISVCIWLLKRVPRSRRQVSMLALKWAKVS